MRFPKTPRDKVRGREIRKIQKEQEDKILTSYIHESEGREQVSDCLEVFTYTALVVIGLEPTTNTA